MNRHKHAWWLVVVLLGLVGYLAHSSLDFDLVSMDTVIQWVGIARDSSVMTVLFFLLFVVGVMVLPVSLFPIIGGVLCEFWWALPLNLIAATTGAWLSFLVSRRFGQAKVEPFLRGRIKSWERVAATKGLKTVLLIRLIGVPPFLVTNYALGLSHVTRRDFLVGTALGILPWMTVITYAAHSVWQALLVGGKEGFHQAVFKAVAPLMIMSVLLLSVLGVQVWAKKRELQKAKLIAG